MLGTITMKLAIIPLFIFLSIQSFGQLSNPYKKFSSDSSYYLISKPFSNQEYDTLGNTTIYSKEGSIKWQIGRYFAGKTVFLSNSGEILTFIVPFNDDDRPISVYKEGVFMKSYQLSEIVELDKGYCNINWMFNSFLMGGVEDTIYSHNYGTILFKDYEADTIESLMDKQKYYTNDEILFLVTCENKISMVDLSSGQMVDVISNGYQYFKDSIAHQDSLITVRTELEYGKEFGLPKMENGKPFDESLAEILGWRNISTDELGTYKPRQGIRIDIAVLINEKGKADILSLNTSDSQTEDLIRKVINDSVFSVETYVEAIGRKYYFDILHFDKKR